MNDPHIDNFYRGIAGQAPAADGDDAPWRLGAELRDVVAARESDLDAAEQAQFSLDQPHMQALQARVYRHLGQGDAGAAAAATAPKPAPPRPGPREAGTAGGLTGVLDLVFGAAWGRAALVLALISMGAALLMRGPPGNASDPALVLRSAADPATLKTAGPAALTAALDRRLAAIGATVIAVERRPGHWVLEVVAQDAEHMAAVQAVLDEYGLPKFAGTKATVMIWPLDGGP